MSSGLASGDSKGRAWAGKDGNFVDQLIDRLGLEECLDHETEYDVFVGKGGSDCRFFHHYIVLESSILPMSGNRLIFELAKSTDSFGIRKVVPNVRISRDSDSEYKITITTTLRYVS